MKLLRLKITDKNGFRSLQSGFEYYFRTEWQVEEELKRSGGLAPFVCAGPNGSGKSNLLEVLAAIFFQLEVLRVRRSFLPDAFYWNALKQQLPYSGRPETRMAYLDSSYSQAILLCNFLFNDPASIAAFHKEIGIPDLREFRIIIRQSLEVYKSDSDYVSETVPMLASDERIMRFKFVKFTKEGVEEPVMLKSLSDGEHQLLHSLGLCLLFKNTNSLFLLDEPETHFNPEWRSSFISRLRECFADADDTHEMLITTHSPFLISDSKPDRVLVFDKQDSKVHIEHPEYNTFGASVNKITLATFGKRETIGGVAQTELERLKAQFDSKESPKDLIDEIYRTLGDSVERTLLLKSILDQNEEKP